ncbi:MAG: hypothetical protein FJ087_16015 [Deltaproteobacteria bacterium]|nr:hypothetical protein [Deltaproteobacteria bacterium]
MGKDFKGKALGAILLQSRMITPDQVELALAEQKRTGKRFGEALVSLGLVSREDVGWGLSQQRSYSFLRVRPEAVDEAAVRAVPADLALEHDVLPYLLVGDELTVVVDDPADTRGVEAIGRATGKRMVVCVGLAEDIRAALDEWYRGTAEPTGAGAIEALLARAVALSAVAVRVRPGDPAEVRFDLGDRVETETRAGEAWTQALARRLDASGPQPHVAAGVAWRAAKVATVDGPAFAFARLTPDAALIEAVRKSGAVARIAGTKAGLWLVTGAGGATLDRLLAALADAIGEPETVVVADAPIATAARVSQVRPDGPGPEARNHAMSAALALAPRLLVVDDLTDPGSHPAALRAVAAGCRVLAGIALSDPGDAVAWLGEQSGSRVLSASALAGVVHAGGRGLRARALTGREKAGLRAGARRGG